MLARALPTIIYDETIAEAISVDDKKGGHQEGLGSVVHRFLAAYFDEHKAHLPEGQLYTLVMGEVEKPLIKATLQLTDGNQKKASEILGINRNTLRKKIAEYGL
jgi:DNA-binding protein Fis